MRNECQFVLVRRQYSRQWDGGIRKPQTQPMYDHYNDVIMSAMASQITSLTIVYSTVYTGANQRKHQSSASLAFVRGIHRWPLSYPHKGPVIWKMFPFDDVIMRSPFIAQDDRSYRSSLHGSGNFNIRFLLQCSVLNLSWKMHNDIKHRLGRLSYSTQLVTTIWSQYMTLPW